ncbi:MAG: CDP-alcohol phosphatidyltransferase family protein, partial [Candidatus Lightella neohaematopini]|nr:CDP-alcohol phosphatidyltransferase family protein [Candidatus Lightella neohaematopini]
MIIFVLASITDWFDGFLARRWKQTSDFGAFLDPVADKVMISVILVLISDQLHYWLITLPSSIIIAREIIISALREWL